MKRKVEPQVEPKLTLRSATRLRSFAATCLMALAGMGACTPPDSSAGNPSGSGGQIGPPTTPGTGGGWAATGGAGIPAGVAGMNGQTGGNT